MGTETTTGRDLLQQELDMLVAQHEEVGRKIEAHRKALAALEISEAANSNESRLVPPESFIGMHVKDALAKLLMLLRRDSIRLNDAVPLLLKGGANLGSLPERHSRTLTIAVSMNSNPKKASHLFDWDRSTDTVTLRARHKRARSA